MIWRYLVSKLGLFMTLVWVADQLHVPVPTDIYTLFVFEIIILVVAIPVTWVWKSFL
jgi:hypothetical protein